MFFCSIFKDYGDIPVLVCAKWDEKKTNSTRLYFFAGREEANALLDVWIDQVVYGGGSL